MTEAFYVRLNAAFAKWWAKHQVDFPGLPESYARRVWMAAYESGDQNLSDEELTP